MWIVRQDAAVPHCERDCLLNVPHRPVVRHEDQHGYTLSRGPSPRFIQRLRRGAVQLVEPRDAGDKVRVELTLTAPGCGMGDFLRMDVQQKLLAIPGVAEAQVDVVLDPPWDQSMMSDTARLQLGLM